MPSTIDIQTIETDDAFFALEPVWNHVLSQCNNNSVFLTWEWIETWWMVYAADYRLAVLLAFEDGRPSAIAPLVIRRREKPRLEFFGQNQAYGEYLGFLVPAGRETDLIGAFCSRLADMRRQGLWETMAFAVVREDQLEFQVICDRLTQLGITTQKLEPRISPVAHLAPSWQSYVAGLDRQFVRRIEYNLRRLSRIGPIRFEMAATSDECRTFFDDFIDMNNERWQRPMDETFIAFHRRIASRFLPLGRLALARLSLAGKPIAVKYDYIFDNKVWGYQGGWDRAFAKYEVGSVLLYKLLAHAATADLEAYDFLEGNEWYKRRWSNRQIVARDIVHGEAGPSIVF